MTRSLYILVIALLMFVPQNAYSQFTDSLIREVNYRLWQGAKAREQVIQLKKELAIDSALIHEKGLVIEKLDKENIKLRTDNAILTETSKQYKRISGALTLLVVLLIL
jgi:hypothetical protein